MENSGGLGGTWWNSKLSNVDRMMLKLGWVELCQLANKVRNQVDKTSFIQLFYLKSALDVEAHSCFTLIFKVIQMFIHYLIYIY